MIGQIIYNRRYCKSVGLKGSKISSLEMKRTQSLKLKKLNDSKTQRSNLNISGQQQSFKKDFTQQKIPFIFSHNHSKVLQKSKSEQKKSHKKIPNLLVQSTNFKNIYQEEEQRNEQKRSKLYFYSNNLGKIKNAQMNKLFNQAGDTNYSKQQQNTKQQQEFFSMHTTYHTQHQFWRKMKKSLSKRNSQRQKQRSVIQAKDYSLEYFYRNTPKQKFL